MSLFIKSILLVFHWMLAITDLVTPGRLMKATAVDFIQYGGRASLRNRIACFSIHWTLRVQNTERHVMSTTRNEPSKYGPDEDHSIPEMIRDGEYWKVWWKKPLCMKASYEFEHRRTRQIYSQLEGFQSPFQTELISWTLGTYCWNNKNESNTFRTDVNNGSDLV